MYIDAHCHLERETYGDELPAVIARAEAAGLTHFVAVGATRVMQGAREAVELAPTRANVYATVGIHPHDAGAATAADETELEELARRPKVVAVGEIGLDYYYDNSPKETQRALFARLIGMAHRRDLPIMLHIRDAHDDAFAILDEVGVPARGGCVHCFTAGPREAEAYLARGMHLSIPGVITFKNAEPLRQAVKLMPLDRLLLETDSPYLAPVPYRGKRNEPSYLVATAEAVGQVRGVTGAEIGRAARDNTLRLFRMSA
jgi:TatD DNase family protein